MKNYTFIIVLLMGTLFAQFLCSPPPDSDSGKTKKNNVRHKYTTSYNLDDQQNAHLIWKKEYTDIEMHIQKSGPIDQRWDFSNASIRINRKSDGSTDEIWDFGETKYTCKKSPSGHVTGKWANGKQDQNSLKTYKKVIDKWCKNHINMIEHEKCNIY